MASCVFRRFCRWGACHAAGPVFLQSTCPANVGAAPLAFRTSVEHAIYHDGWLVWRTGGFRANRIALSLFLVQLALNSLWSWLFFTWLLGGLAFADIVFLWGLIAATIVSFWRVRPLAGALLIPYLLWVTFAAALNYSVWQLNLQVLG